MAAFCWHVLEIIDVSPALILLGAIFYPVAVAANISILQFAAVLVCSLAVGLFTPPVGTTLIISCYIGHTKLMDGFKACLPFLFPMLCIIALLVMFPVLTTGLPTLLFH